MTWVKWFMQYNKAFVPLIMTLLYFLNKEYGIDLPVSSDDAALVLGMVTSLIVYQVPNVKVDD